MTKPAIVNSDIKGVECRHVVYCESKVPDSRDDLLFVKEAVHTASGAIVPRKRFVKNFKRDFYVTKDGFRNHRDKKLFESIDKVYRMSSTQRDLSRNVARALRARWVPDMRILARSQYLYGVDVPSTTIYKQQYKDKWPDLVSLNSVAVCDLETDVLYTGGRDIISGSITFKDRAVLVINESFLEDGPKVKDRINEKLHYYLALTEESKLFLRTFFGDGDLGWQVRQASLVAEMIRDDDEFAEQLGKYYKTYLAEAKTKALEPMSEQQWLQLVGYLGQDSYEAIRDDIVRDVVYKRGIKLEIIFAENPGDLVVKLIGKAHEWQPDFLAFWNIDFDIPKMIETLKNYGIDPAEVFSDPSVPPEFRCFEYRQGKKIKITESGRTMPLSPAEQWHTVTCPATFYPIDAMCVYQKIRIGRGKMSFSLDATLERHLGIRKLKFKEADGLEKLAWHEYMQKNYKLEYLIYNLFDCIGVELLDEKTMDLSSTITLLCRSSDYSKFSSQPRRTCDRLHFFGLQHKHVMGSTSDKIVDELDALVVTPQDWIITLPAHQIVESEYHPLVEFPELTSQVYLHVGDKFVRSISNDGVIII